MYSEKIKPLGYVGFLLLSFALAVYFLLNTEPARLFVHKKISWGISNATNLEFSAKSFEFDVKRLTVVFEKPKLADLNGEQIFYAESLKVSIDPIPLLWGAVLFDRILIEEAELDITIVNGRVRGLDSRERVTEESEASVKRPQFRAENLLVTNLKLNINNVDNKQKLNIPKFAIKGFVDTDGMSHIELLAEGGELQNADKVRPIDKLSLNIDYEEGCLTINDLALSMDSSKLWLKGKLADDLSSAENMAIKLETPLDLVQFAFPNMPKFEGEIKLSGGISGHLKNPVGEVEIEASDISIDDGEDVFVVENFAVKAKTKGDDKIYIERFQSNFAEGDTRLTAVINRDQNLTFTAEGTSKKIHFGKIMENVTVPRSRADFFGDVEFKVSGNMLNGFLIEGDAKVEVSDFRVIEKPYNVIKNQFDIINIKSGTVTAHFFIDERAFHWHHAVAKFGRNSIRVTGGLYFTLKDGLLLICKSQGDFYMEDLGHIAGMPVAGKGSIDGYIRGPYDEPSISGNFTLSEGAFEGNLLGQVAGKVYFKDLKLFFPDIKGAYRNTAYNGYFELDFSDALLIKSRVAVSQGRLEEFFRMLKIYDDLPKMQGGFSGEALFSIKPEKSGSLNGVLNAKLEEGEIAGHKFDGGELKAAAEESRITINAASLKRRGSVIYAGGEIERDGLAKIRVSGKKYPLEELAVVRSSELPLKGELDALLFVSGKYPEPLLDGRVRIENVRYGSNALQPSFLVFTSEGDTMYINGSINGGEASLGVTTQMDGKHPFNARGFIKNALLKPYLTDKFAEKSEFKGHIKGVASVSGEFNDINKITGAIKLDEANASMGPLKIEAPSPIKFKFAQERMIFEDVSLAGKDLSLTVKGYMPFDDKKETALTASGNMTLGWINQLGLEDIRLRGMMAFDVNVGGALKKPTVLGNGKVIKGMLSIPASNIRVNEIHGKVIFNHNKLVFDEIGGNIGSGTAKFSGYIPLVNWSLKDVRISIDLLRAPTTIIEDMPATLNGKLTLAGVNEQRIRLSGELTLEDAAYRKDVEMNSIFKKKSSPPQEDEGGSSLDLDLSIYVPETLRVDNNLTQTRLSGNLSIRGNAAKPLITGKLYSNAGRFVFRQTEFAVQRFELDFQRAEEFNPNLDIFAFADINERRIFIQIFGSFNDPQIEYSSPHGLSNQDINHLIMFGITPDEAEHIDDATLSSVLGFEMLATIAGVDRVVRQLKLESFSVSSRYSDYSRSTEPYLNMALKPSKNVRLIYTSSLTNIEDRKAELRLNLGKITSISGEYVNQSDLANTPNVGVDLKFKWEF